jgi:hypothetical protein
MMVEVYHWYVLPSAEENHEVVETYRDIMFGRANAASSALQALGEWALKGLVLQPVAKVDGDVLDRAWALTNHIDHAWTKNAGLQVLGHGRWRSSCVGDVMRTGGEVYVVGRFGFDHVGPAVTFALVDAY